MLQHYVFIKYQDNVPGAHINSFIEKMQALRHSIVEIKALHIGRDELKENRSWDLILDMQFDSLEDLRHYQSHPEHQAAMAFNSPHVADVGAIDFHK
ncbi:Dabb family protein [Marinomonas sp. THO17]|uniref:Dabb family protein n=1 Tax=Marinomonas sp. THO17 TaxID=3149048 RepID=UPI00336C211C